MWLSDRKRRALTKDEDYRRRIELIQDFEFSTACQRVRVCPDGEHIIAAGTYPPTLKAFTVSDLSLKFERRFTCEIVNFAVLGEDFGKLVALQADRMLAFHAPYGAHYSLRIPKFGRDLAYQKQTCDLYIGASGAEVYTLNLDVGTFKAPLVLKFDGCSCVRVNPVHGLVGTAGDSTLVQFFDSRSDAEVSTLNVGQAVKGSDGVFVTALSFDVDGLTMGVGTNRGHTIVYDIRSSHPLYVKVPYCLLCLFPLLHISSARPLSIFVLYCRSISTDSPSSILHSTMDRGRYCRQIRKLLRSGSERVRHAPV